MSADLATNQQVVEDNLSSAIFKKMVQEVYQINEANGWYEDIDKRTFGDEIALIHSEVSEMIEAYRSHGFEDFTAPLLDDQGDVISDNAMLPKPEGVGSEAADVFIRLLDTCYRHGIDLFAEYRRKCEYNKTRGYRHGGKKL